MPDNGSRGTSRRRRDAWPYWAFAGIAVLLLVVGVVAAVTRPSGSPAAAPDATPTQAAPTGEPSASGSPTPQDGTDGEAGGTPPMPASLPAAGNGKTTVLDVGGPDSSREGRTVRYTVEIEGGLGVPAEHFAHTVRTVLQDQRGWEKRDGVHFVNVGPQERSQGAETDIRIILGSPEFVDRNCLPLQTGGRLSCHSRGKVLLNVDRWAHGADTYGGDVARYRIYQISHEVGHSIGHGHESCPAPDALAPVMVQQTKTLQGCRPWPYPVRPTSG